MAEIEDEDSNIVIQINGKKRGLITLSKKLNEEEIVNKVIKDKKLSKYFNNIKIKKQIYIKNKLINFIL